MIVQNSDDHENSKWEQLSLIEEQVPQLKLHASCIGPKRIYQKVPFCLKYSQLPLAPFLAICQLCHRHEGH